MNLIIRFHIWTSLRVILKIPITDTSHLLVTNLANQIKLKNLNISLAKILNFNLFFIIKLPPAD